jgi:hypothetical protein
MLTMPPAYDVEFRQNVIVVASKPFIGYLSGRTALHAESLEGLWRPFADEHG